MQARPIATSKQVHSLCASHAMPHVLLARAIRAQKPPQSNGGGRAGRADHAQLLGREKVATNVTCLQPAEEGAGNNVIDDELASTPLREGRTCEGGCCTDACSRVVFPTFATQEEVRGGPRAESSP